MAKNSPKKAPRTDVADYSMDKEYSRPKLPPGEYSGIAPENLPGVGEIKTVKYPLGREGADLSAEFAARDPDLDPQYIWRGKRRGDLNELEVKAPIIYQQEKIFPRMLIEEMKRRTAIRKNAAEPQMQLGEGVEGFDPNVQPGFYNHEEGWKNRLILGDSLQVMASLAENEALRGKVQMVYFDPPYGIKFNSNWQPTTKSTNVKDGNREDITHEPEMVKAFRDTWHDGVHSYLGYLRDRLVVARDLLAESGSCFVQIGDENVHRVRAVMDEVFGEENFVSQITYTSTSGLGGERLSNATNYILWFSKNIELLKWRTTLQGRDFERDVELSFKRIQLSDGTRQPLNVYERLNGKVTKSALYKIRAKLFALSDVTSANHGQGVGEGGFSSFEYEGRRFSPGSRTFTTHREGMTRLAHSDRLAVNNSGTLRYVRYHDDFDAMPINNVWTDTTTGGFKSSEKIYVVQTAELLIQRCMLMTTDPGDLVLDPTCGSGTTAYVAEQWGRRWITIDTSRVALALARTRLMTAKFPYYLLADSDAGVKKEMEITGKAIVRETYGKIAQGFVYARVPHITLKSIANNAEIDIIWKKYEDASLNLRKQLAQHAGEYKGATPEEWQVPFAAPPGWDDAAKAAHAQFLELKRARQKEIDDSIARVAETEYLYDKPYEDKKRVRVAGPFTVESVAPTRALIVNPDGSTTDPVSKIAKDIDYGNGENYVARMIEILRRSGVKQAKKGDRITFNSVTAWAGGKHIAAEGWTEAAENRKTKHFAIAFGPEFGSVTRLDMKAATREAMEGGFDVLLYCAFNFEAYVEEGSDSAFGKLKVLHARMNSDLHMAETDLKDTGSGNPFIIFGEPDIEVNTVKDTDELTVTIKGVDVYDPKSDEVRSDNADAIDCWMLDTDYNEEAFFARHVYFPGRDKVYDAFKKFLNNDIDPEEWASVAQTTSRPFPRPKNGRIAVKVINHFGDEVMKIFKV